MLTITSTGPIGPIPTLSRSYGNTFFSRTSIQFTQALDSADETTLRTWAIESGHTIEGETPAIAAFILPGDAGRPITAVDYRRSLSVRLARVVVTADNGDVARTLYYDPSDLVIAQGSEQFELAAGATPIVSEHPVYTPGTIALVERAMVIRWYDTAGSVYASKTTAKHYQPAPSVGAHPSVNLQAGEVLLNEGLAASRRKRENAVERSTSYAQTAATRFISDPANVGTLTAFMSAAGIADPAQGALAWVITELQALAGRLQSDRDLFIQAADTALVASVTSDSAVWLDTVLEDGGTQTGRQAMVAVLTSAVGG